MSERERPPTYWRSLADLERSAEFDELVAREFPHAATEVATSEGRRRFVQLMGASLALAGAGCRYPQDKLITQTKRPNDMTPGEPKRFATAMDFAGSAVGLHVTSYDGRPIKIEGNPEHPESLGAANVYHQASVLELYDPDRQKQVSHDDTASSWDAFVKDTTAAFRKHRQNTGRGLRILSEFSSSPTLARLKDRFLNVNPDAKWIEWEPITRDAEIAGAKLAFGKAMRTHLKLDKADVILSLGDDLFVERPDSLRLTREFARRRAAGDKGDGKVSRFYAVETRFSTSGGKADHRLPLRTEQIKAFLVALDAKLSGGSAPGGTDSFLGKPHVATFLDAVAEDLKGHNGAAVVTVGRGMAPEVHALAHKVNAAIGAAGKTVVYTDEPNAGESFANLKALVKEMAAGDVSTLVILGVNPVFAAPADLDFAGAMKKLDLAVHLGLYKDETALACNWRIPKAHFLESWGDAQAFDGTVSVVQPLIEPLYKESKTCLDFALFLLQQPVGLDGSLRAVRDTHKNPVPAANAVDDKKEAAWRTIVEAGEIEGSAFKPTTPTLAALPATATNVEARALKAELGLEDLEVVFHPCPKLYDGRYANNGWLQELPESMTKMTWDNAAVMSKQTAEALGLPTAMEDGWGRFVKLSANGRELEIPAYVLPGHAVGSVSLFLGYGRTAAGHIGGSENLKIDPVGVNVNLMRTSDKPDQMVGVKATASSRTHRFSCTQEHHIIDLAGMKARDERLGELVYEIDAEKASKPGYKLLTGHAAHAANGELPIIQSGEHERNLSSWHQFDWQEPEYKGKRWGMAIDLSKCTGCNACVVACQAENNIPIVGKEQVWRSREMHWIRVDRYFKGDVDHPEQVESVNQPMPCQQCENAPCESVCPVAATSHSNEGLNDMAYNRCIGTRYCSNNCPYKVRRFNFFNYRKEIEKPENEVARMVYNPEVTVRVRGVMEKCTYCVQRIQNGKIAAKREGRQMGQPERPIRDGEILTACQQTCPAEAIVFGDLGQMSSTATQVAQKHKSNRAFTVLDELNNKPRTRYLAVVRNHNPKLAHEKKADDGHH